MYNTPYSAYNPYSHTTPYNSYTSPYASSYGVGGGGFGYGGPIQAQESDFVRIAEERSRTALSSVETVVQAFASITMMLESTLTAFYSSFRAVLGVADQFSRLRAQLYNVLSTVAALKTLRWMLHKLLVLMRLKPVGYELTESAWSNAADGASMLPAAARKPGTNYFALTFFAIAVGGPYLIWKLIRTIVQQVEDSRKWSRGEAEYYEARCTFDFITNQQTELSFKAGEMLRVAPKEEQPNVRGWVLAAEMSGERVGLVPNNYIEIVGRRNVATEQTFEKQFTASSVSEDHASKSSNTQLID